MRALPGSLIHSLLLHSLATTAGILAWCVTSQGHAAPAIGQPATLPAYQPHPIVIDPSANYLTATGKIRITGYNDMRSLLSSLADAFTGFHPGTEFELALKETRSAPGALADGSSLLAPMGAEFEDQALADYRRAVGSDPVLFRVAHASLSPNALSGPLFFFVHPANPLQNVSMLDAQRILTGTGSPEPLTHWGQLGLGGEWRDLPISPCGVAADSALASFLQKHHFGQARFAANFTGFRQSAEAVEFGAGNPAAFCFASYNRRTEGVKPLAVSVAPGTAPVEISKASVMSGAYPLDRHLLIYARQSACGAIDPVAAELLELVFSAIGQSLVAMTPEQYLPLNSKEIREEQIKLARFSECRRVH